MKGMLPRAYLRIDPNLDQTHPEPLAMLLLLCAANRQPSRGRFKSRSILDGLLGRGRVQRLIDRGDISEIEDGRWYVDKWDLWQEGDLTVGDRMRRLRGVTPPSQERDIGVAGPSPASNPPSEASRRLGVKALDVTSPSSSASHISRPLADIAARLRAEGGG